jgi:hypothetical protein
MHMHAKRAPLVYFYKVLVLLYKVHAMLRECNDWK